MGFFALADALEDVGYVNSKQGNLHLNLYIFPEPMGLFQVPDQSTVPTSKPSLESLKPLTKILHIHRQWQELIFKGEKTWELSHWGKPQKQLASRVSVL